MDEHSREVTTGFRNQLKNKVQPAGGGSTGKLLVCFARDEDGNVAGCVYPPGYTLSFWKEWEELDVLGYAFLAIDENGEPTLEKSPRYCDMIEHSFGVGNDQVIRYSAEALPKPNGMRSCSPTRDSRSLHQGATASL